MSKEIEIQLAWLDGYLTGVVSLNGQINDYYAGAFLLNVNEEETLESALAAYFAPNCQIHFTNKRAEISWGQLESEIQGFIADNILSIKTEFFESTILSNRKKYISFKVMDMIDIIISGNKCSSEPYVKEQIYRIEAKFEHRTSNSILYCIFFGAKVLALQFMKRTR